MKSSASRATPITNTRGAGKTAQEDADRAADSAQYTRHEHGRWGRAKLLDRLHAITHGSDLWLLPADERNAAIYAANRDRPLADVRDEAQAVFAQLLPLVAALDAADLIDPARYTAMPRDWVPGKLLAENTYEHYQAYTLALRAWLEQ